MSDGLKQRIKQTKPFESPAQEAMLNLLVAGAHIREQIQRVCESYGIGFNHYNVLRILNGAPAEGYPRCEIIRRVMDRGPDVTRLTDRLVRLGLLQRERSTEDRRVMLHQITPKGRALLAEMRGDMREIVDRFAEQVTPADQEELSRICEQIYLEDEVEPVA